MVKEQLPRRIAEAEQHVLVVRTDEYTIPAIEAEPEKAAKRLAVPIDMAASCLGSNRHLLRCPKCKGCLHCCGDCLVCTNERCAEEFPLVEGIPVLINDENSVFKRDDFVRKENTTFDLSRNGFVRRLDEWLPTLGRNLKARQNYRTLAELLLKRSANPVVLITGASILGEGLDELLSDPRIQLVECDVSFGPRTQLICDAHDLPFEDRSFDAVILQAVLQYVADPSRCIQETERVLKPGGLIYAETAFMQQVVHGRYDFTRFTHLGLRRLLRGFEEVRSGPVCGPGMALAWSCQFFLLSFAVSRWSRRIMHVLGRLTLFWIKYLDTVLIDKPGAYDAASGFFFLGTKSDEMLSDRELVALYRGIQ